MKGLPTSSGPTLSMAITLDKGVFPEYIIKALNSPQVKEEFCLHLFRIVNQLRLNTPFSVGSYDWIMKSKKPVSITFHVNSWSSTSDIFENKWDPNASRDPQAEHEIVSSWRVGHPYLLERRDYEQDSPEQSGISKKDTKDPNPFLLPWTTALTNIFALVGIVFIIHHSVYPLDTTPASLQFVLSLWVEFWCTLGGFLISSFFRPLFLRVFLVLINF